MARTFVLRLFSSLRRVVSARRRALTRGGSTHAGVRACACVRACVRARVRACSEVSELRGERQCPAVPTQWTRGAAQRLQVSLAAPGRPDSPLIYCVGSVASPPPPPLGPIVPPRYSLPVTCPPGADRSRLEVAEDGARGRPPAG
jgi:hypothetical protein